MKFLELITSLSEVSRLRSFYFTAAETQTAQEKNPPQKKEKGELLPLYGA